MLSKWWKKTERKNPVCEKEPNRSWDLRTLFNVNDVCDVFFLDCQPSKGEYSAYDLYTSVIQSGGGPPKYCWIFLKCLMTVYNFGIGIK